MKSSKNRLSKSGLYNKKTGLAKPDNIKTKFFNKKVALSKEQKRRGILNIHKFIVQKKYMNAHFINKTRRLRIFLVLLKNYMKKELTATEDHKLPENDINIDYIDKLIESSDLSPIVNLIDKKVNIAKAAKDYTTKDGLAAIESVITAPVVMKKLKKFEDFEKLDHKNITILNKIWRLRKILKTKFIPPISAGECFMFASVATLMHNDAIKENYDKLEQRLTKKGTLNEFNAGLKKMVETFAKGSVRQRKHVPADIQDWIGEHKEDIVHVLLYEMTKILPQKEFVHQETDYAKFRGKYMSLFLHSRILRNITRTTPGTVPFNKGGHITHQLSLLLKFVKNADIKFAEELFLDVDAKGKDFPKYIRTRSPIENDFFNHANATYLFHPASRQFFRKGSPEYRREKENSFGRKVFSAQKFKINMIAAGPLGHVYVYKQNIKTGKWVRYDTEKYNMSKDVKPKKSADGGYSFKEDAEELYSRPVDEFFVLMERVDE